MEQTTQESNPTIRANRKIYHVKSFLQNHFKQALNEISFPLISFQTEQTGKNAIAPIISSKIIPITQK